MNNLQFEEEKYGGPLLPDAPEMIVSSGALGITPPEFPMFPEAINEARPRHVPWTPRRTRGQNATVVVPKPIQLQPNRALPPLRVRRKRDEPEPPKNEYTEEMEEKYAGPMFQSTSSANSFPSSSAGPSKKVRAVNREVLDPTTVSIMSVAKQATGIEMQQAEPPKPEIPLTEEEKLAKEKQEKELLRFKEIGRRISELDLTDFSYDKQNTERRTFMIATRGEEILASIRRNLTVIHTKLGEYADGTIFEDVEKLTKSFSNVSPNALSRINQRVADILKERADAALLKEAEMASKAEEPQVKLEEPDYTC